MSACTQTINLSAPARSERVRDFQPPWRTVFIYRCSACGAEHRVRAVSFRGRQAVPGIGGILCGRPLAESGS